MADGLKPGVRWSDEYAVCPWCGYEHGDCWDWVKDRVELECEDCGKAFTVEAEYSVEYRSFVTGQEKP